MTDRKQQILRQACRIIATEGYASLTMRAVARASGLKLGALQYHYPTWGALLQALADFIIAEFRAGYAAEMADKPGDLRALVAFAFADPTVEALDADRLFPQLWAMALVEPAMKRLVDGWYEEYLHHLEECLRVRGARTPRADALAVMAMLEGLALFVGQGARWETEAPAVMESIQQFIDARYPETA